MAKLDQHYYEILYLGHLAGISDDITLQIAWASGLTDFYETPKFRTFCRDLDSLNPDTQRNVIVCFHAIPGDDPSNKWIVTPNSSLCRDLMAEAINDPIQLGVALHPFVDSFSHQSFTGFREKVNHNSDNVIYHGQIAPEILHAEYLDKPDDMDAEWERHGVEINNKARAYHVAVEVYRWLCQFRFGGGTYDDGEAFIAQELAPLWSLGYEERKIWFMHKSGICVRYQEAVKMFKDKEPEFEQAAKRHQLLVLERIKEL